MEAFNKLKQWQKILVIVAVVFVLIGGAVLVFGGGKGSSGTDREDSGQQTDITDDEKIPDTEISFDDEEIPDTEVSFEDEDEDKDSETSKDDKDDKDGETDKNDDDKDDDKQETGDGNEKDDTTETYKTELGAGHYVAGVDFPAGTYTIKAISGSGNVSSSNMHSDGLNEIMASKEDKNHITTYENAKFAEGTKLSISSSVVISISSSNADVSGMKEREESDAEVITLSSGKYVAGKDFPAGTYTVVGTGSLGNVSSDNMYYGGLNEIMGSGNDGMSIKEFKNAKLDQGTTLTVSGTSVKLVPVGD